MEDHNAKVIAEFRANEGRVGGPFEGAPMVLVHSMGRRTGAERVNPMMYLPDGSDAEVRELVLEVDRSDLPYEVGQSVGVLAPGDRTMGQRFHYRLYSVADLPEAGPSGHPRLKICVRRCSWVDEYSGERRPGVASNYLCDLAAGDRIELTGPFGLAFAVPEDPTTDLLLIGSGTGIAPFRAFVKHLYRHHPDWQRSTGASTPGSRIATAVAVSAGDARTVRVFSSSVASTIAQRSPERRLPSTHPSLPSASRMRRQISNSAMISTGRPNRT